MTCKLRLAGIAAFVLTLSWLAAAQLAPSADATPFPPLDQWKNAVLAADTAGLTSLYSTSPALQVQTDKGASDAASETNFWIGLKAQKIDLNVIQKQSPQTSVQVMVFQATVQSANDTVYVTEAQAWQQQSDGWRLVVVKHTQATHLQQPAAADKTFIPTTSMRTRRSKNPRYRPQKITSASCSCSVPTGATTATYSTWHFIARILPR